MLRVILHKESIEKIIKIRQQNGILLLSNPT